MKKNDLQDIYPLAPLQEGLLFHYLSDEHSNAYFEQITFRLQGEVDLCLFEASWNLLLQRHDILRTVFSHEKTNRPLQVVLRQRQIELRYHDLSYLPSIEQQQQLQHYQQQDRHHPFNLTKDVLMRFYTLQRATDDYWIIWSHPHILLDGWSVGILYREFIQTYQALKQGLKPSFANAVPYVRYIQWLEQQNEQRSAQFWQQYLADYEQLTGIPQIPLRVAPSATNKLAEYRFSLSSIQTQQLQHLALQQRTTVSTVLQAVWSLLLSRYNQSDDVVFGVTASVRPESIQGINDMVGLLINTIPCRFRLQPEQTFSAFLQQAQEAALNRQEHQHYPLHKIQQQTGRRELFNHVLVFENYPLDEQLRNDVKPLLGFSISEIDFPEQTHYDMGVMIIPSGDNIRFRLMYNPAFYQALQFERLAEHLHAIITSVIEQPHIPLRAIRLLASTEREQLLFGFNQTHTDYPREQTISALFEEQVALNPEHLAVCFKHTQLTYSALNQSANQLAQQLRAHYQIQANDLVGVLLGRSERWIIAALAVLKAGGAYVPLDPAYPAERIDYILQDTQCKVVLTDSEYAHLAGSTPTLLLDDSASLSGEYPNLAPVSQPNSLAYVIYTSGTTGQPKGVMVPQRGVVRLVKNTNYLTFHAGQRFIQTTTFTFDPSVIDVWGGLLNGGSLYILGENELLDMGVLKHTLQTHAINTFITTTGFCQQLIEQDVELFANLQTVMIGGEKVSAVHAERVLSAYPNLALLNAYGPTENTAITTCYRISLERPYQDIPIGKPIANTQVYILDTELEPVPMGVFGRLYIGGDGLALGYLSRPDQTANCFIANPFRANERTYDSGDLARWLPDGNIEFLGRKDEQVKIRGYRVECSEVEHGILQHTSIRQAVVIARTLPAGYKELVAYIVSDAAFTVAELRSFLSAHLPDYMIPAKFMFLEQLPLTANHKIDKRKLPEPTELDTQDPDYVAPATPLEQQLATIWQEVLGVPRISVMANYFDVGGDSIKAIQIMARLRKLNLKCDINAFFKHPTIRALIPQVVSLHKSIPQQTISGLVPLTPIQQWFFKLAPSDARHHFNQALLFKPTQALNPIALQTALQALLQHHDALRMTYGFTDQGVVQDNRTEAGFNLHQETIALEQLTERLNALQQSFDLTKDTLVKAVLFSLRDGSERLFMMIHHLVVDGVSWRILLEDLATAYEQAQAGKAIQLPLKTHAFKERAEYLQAYSQSHELLAELPYWQEVEQQVTASNLVLEQHLTQPRQMHTLSSVLAREATTILLGNAHRAYNTRGHELLLAALAIAVHRWQGHSQVAVTLESHGREGLGELDIARTVGWFTATYPVVLDITAANTLGERIGVVKETLRQVPQNGLGYGVLKYLTSNSPLKANSPAIAFNYLGQFDADIPSQLLALASESVGQSFSPHIRLPEAIALSGMVTNQRLKLTLDFDTLALSAESAQALLDHYVQALQDIIQHCQHKPSEITPSDLTYSGLSIAQLRQFLTQIKRSAAEVQDIYPLSPMQEGLLFHYLYDTQTTAFFQQAHYRLIGQVDAPTLQAAWNEIFRRHAVLRTLFVYEQVERPLQVVLKERQVDFRYLDKRGQISVVNADEFMRQLMSAERQQPFDLTDDVLVRVTLVQFAHDQWRLILTLHHILVDGWCIALLYQEFMAAYEALRQGKANTLPLARPYADYIRWFAEQDKQSSARYWQDYLAGFQQTTGIPAGGQAPNEASSHHRAELYEFELPASLSAQLQHTASSCHVTLNTLLQALWALLLARYNGCNDVVFGAAVSGRPEEIVGVESIIGLFMNTLPVRIKLQPQASFRSLLQTIQDQAVQTRPHSYFPLAEIQAQSALKQGLFNHLLVHENYPVSATQDTQARVGFRLEVTQDIYREINYDLGVIIEPRAALTFQLLYKPEVYNPHQMRLLAGFIQHLSEQVVANPQISLNSLQLMDHNAAWRPLKVVPNTLGQAFQQWLSTQSLPTHRACIFNRQGYLAPPYATGMIYLTADKSSGFIGRYWGDDHMEIIQEPDHSLVVQGQLISLKPLQQALQAHPAIREVSLLKLLNKANERFVLALVATPQRLEGESVLEYLADKITPELSASLALLVLPALPLGADGQLDREAVLTVIAVSEPKFSTAKMEAEILIAMPELDDVAIIPEFETLEFPPLHMSDLLQHQQAYLSEAVPENNATATQAPMTEALPEGTVMAFADGGVVDLDPNEPTTMVAALYRAARDYAHRGTVYVNKKGEEHYQSYADLLHEAQCILNGLHQQGLKAGDTVILQQQDLYDHLTGFWACILGGIKPVTVATSPTYAQKTSVVNKLYNAWELLEHPLIFASPHLVEPINGLNNLFGVTGLKAIAVHGKEFAAIECDYRADPEDIAFYQLTSGSTGIPKCIQERNKGIYYHVYGASQYNHYTRDDVYLNWPPSDHVGALIIFYIKAVYLGVKQVAVNTDLVLNNPLKWLDLLEAHRVTFTWSPNFGYKLVSEHLKKTDRRWDLSSVRFFMNAAEQVTLPVVEEFLHLVKDFGVPEKAMQPAYGMAETCTAIQYKNDFSVADGCHWFEKSSLKGILQKTTERGKDTVSFVKLGKSMPGVQIRIVDQNNQLVPEGKIGALHVRGEVITPGYLNNPAANAESQVGDGWFNTGDLGFILNGELSITGRQKEIIIIRAANFYCYEIEDIVNRVEGVQPTFVGSSAINDPASGTEGLAIFFVPQPDVDLIELYKAIRTCLAMECGITPAYIIPMAKEEFPKTTSGKIQRVQLREALETGQFNDIIRETDLLLANERTLPDWFFIPSWQRKEIGVTESDTPVVIDLLLGSDPALMDALQPAVWVQTRQTFSRRDQHTYTLNPTVPSDYVALLQAIQRDGLNIKTVVHTLATETVNTLSATGLQQANEHSTFSLVLLLQALQQTQTVIQTLLVVSYANHLVLDTDKAQSSNGSLRGVIKTLAQEQPQLRSRHIDLDTQDPQTAATLIRAELAATHADAEVAYRQHQRYISCLHKIDFTQTQKQPIELKKGGLYVITGGLGGIGRELAQLLSTHYQAHLILTGRTALEQDTDKLQAFTHLQKVSKGQVYYQVLDVCDQAALSQLIQQAEQRSGQPLAGIFHLAGESNSVEASNPESNHLGHITLKPFEQLFHTKVQGTQALLELLKDYPQAFFMGFSSVNGFFGGTGVAPYAAANSYLESAVAAFNREQGRVRAYSLAWSLWDGVGMSLHNTMQQAALAKGFHAITLAEGIKSFLVALEAGQVQTIIGLDPNNTFIQAHMQPVPIPKQELAAYYTLKPDQKDDEERILSRIDLIARSWQARTLNQWR